MKKSVPKVDRIMDPPPENDVLVNGAPIWGTPRSGHVVKEEHLKNGTEVRKYMRHVYRSCI